MGREDSTFTFTVKNGDTATNDFTYSDTVTVEAGGIKSLSEGNGRDSLDEGKVYLFDDDWYQDEDGHWLVEDAIASGNVHDGAAALSYHWTSKSSFSAGENKPLWIVYRGSGILQEAAQAFAVNLHKKPITAVVDEGTPSATKPYGDNANFSNVRLKLNGLVNGDDIYGRAYGKAAEKIRAKANCRELLLTHLALLSTDIPPTFTVLRSTM